MAQLLSNPDLAWDGKTEYLTWQTDDLSSTKTVAIERPTGWQYVYESQERAPNNIPQSLHIDDGMKLAYGDGKFKAGYAQLVDIPANQRLLLKVTYDLATGSPNIIYGQLIVDGAVPVQSDRTLLKDKAEKLFVFEAAQAGKVTVKFMASSDYAVKPTDLYIHTITLEDVSATYGNPAVPPVVVPYGAGTPAPTPTPSPVPTPTPSPTPDPNPSPLPGGAQVIFQFRGTIAEFLQLAQALRGL